MGSSRRSRTVLCSIFHFVNYNSHQVNPLIDIIQRAEDNDGHRTVVLDRYDAQLSKRPCHIHTPLVGARSSSSVNQPQSLRAGAVASSSERAPKALPLS